MARIGAAMAQGPDEARRLLAAIWDDGPDALRRVAVAHYLADLQTDPHDELAWDRRALAEAEAVTDDRARAKAHGTGLVDAGSCDDS